MKRSLETAVPLRTDFLRVLAQNGAGRIASNEVRVDVTSACAVPAAPVGFARTASGTLPIGTDDVRAVAQSAWATGPLANEAVIQVP